MDDAFGHWLAGFIDGEGCFAAVVDPAGRQTWKWVEQSPTEEGT